MGNSNCFQSSSSDDDDDDDEDEVLTRHNSERRSIAEPVSASTSVSQPVRPVAHASRESVAQQQRVSASAPAASSNWPGARVDDHMHRLASRRPQDEEEEDRRIKLAQRMSFIYQIPTGVFDASKKSRECAICMVDFEMGESLRYLPCMHAYHQSCIDDWLLRSLTCPSCMQPVDAGLLATFGFPDD